MANETDLSQAVENVQKGIQEIDRDLHHHPDLNARYKVEITVFAAFAMELIGLQGKLKAETALTPDACKDLCGQAETKILPQISNMESINTQVLGMGQFNTKKNIRDANAKALNKRLGDLKIDVLALCTELQATAASGAGTFGKADLPEMNDDETVSLGKSITVAPPTFAELADDCDKLVESLDEMHLEQDV